MAGWNPGVGNASPESYGSLGSVAQGWNPGVGNASPASSANSGSGGGGGGLLNSIAGFFSSGAGTAPATVGGVSPGMLSGIMGKVPSGYGSRVVPASYSGPTPGKFAPAQQAAMDNYAYQMALRMGVPEIVYTSGTDHHSANHAGHAIDMSFSNTLGRRNTPENRARMSAIAGGSGFNRLGLYSNDNPDMLHVDTTPGRPAFTTWNDDAPHNTDYAPELAPVARDFRAGSIAPLDRILPAHTPSPENGASILDRFRNAAANAAATVTDAATAATGKATDYLKNSDDPAAIMARNEARRAMIQEKFGDNFLSKAIFSFTKELTPEEQAERDERAQAMASMAEMGGDPIQHNAPRTHKTGLSDASLEWYRRWSERYGSASPLLGALTDPDNFDIDTLNAEEMASYQQWLNAGE
jgi:hypothetical protein